LFFRRSQHALKGGNSMNVTFLASMQVTPFTPQDNVKIETDPEAKEPKDAVMSTDDATRIEELCAELDTLRQGLQEGFRLTPISFEKDDDSNFHMDLITSLANMRARNYSIGEVRFCLDVSFCKTAATFLFKQR
jgi:hypothetical protein